MAYKPIEQLLIDFIYAMPWAKPGSNNTTPCDICLLIDSGVPKVVQKQAIQQE
jgi:hypothetical protein